MNSPLNILLVEDSPDDAQLILRHFKKEGIDVTYRRVDTESDFIAALDSPPDLILSDFAMPQFSGLQALKILRAHALDIPFILVSGTIGEEVAVQAIKEGADDYLMKDRLMRLGSAIQIALNQKRLRDEKAQADIAVRNSEARFRSLIENSSDEVSIISADGSLLYESPSSNPPLGHQPGEFLNKNVFELVHPEDVERVQNQFAQLLNDPSQHPRQRFRLLHRDGKWIWIEAVGTNLLNEPSVLGIVVNYHDVTEHVRAEKALRESEEQYRNLFEDSPISLWVEDFTKVKIKLDALRESGVTDIPLYLREHPDFVMDCARSVEILDVNTAALMLYHAIRKEDLMGNLENIYETISSEQLEYELIQMANGKLNFEREGTDRTLTGEEIHVNVHWSVVPGYEHNLARVIVSTVDLSERKRAEEEIQLQLQRLNALRAIDLAISNTFDMNLSLKVVINGALSQLGVNAASVLLFNQVMSTLEYVAGEGFNFPTIDKTLLRIGEGLAGRAALERNTIQVNNLEQVGKEFTRGRLLKEEGFVSYFAIPLVAKGELKGVFEVFSRTEIYPDKEWINFLETLAGQAALAIHDSQLFTGLQRSNIDLRLAYDATIEGWSAALDLRDKETEGHSQRVTEMTLGLARKMGIPESELSHMRHGALLHDIGKLGIPDHILLKTDKLTSEEWQIMQKHPTYAYEMLSTIAYLKPALDIPYAHHEKWDGSGYPRGLKKEEIPLAARIFAVVDVWDALTNDRIYRAAWSKETALTYIQEQSGKHFDPKVVEIFLDLLNIN